MNKNTPHAHIFMRARMACCVLCPRHHLVITFIIPAELGNLIKLTYINFNNNALTGWAFLRLLASCAFLNSSKTLIKMVVRARPLWLAFCMYVWLHLCMLRTHPFWIWQTGEFTGVTSALQQIDRSDHGGSTFLSFSFVEFEPKLSQQHEHCRS